VKDIHDVIKHAKFGDDRLRGSEVVAGQILAFPIDFAGRPYNTLTLPCERVITECAEKCKPLQLKGMAPSAVTPRAEMTRAQTHRAETPNAESGPARQDSRTD